MKVSYNWLKEFIDLKLSPEETAEKLTLIGLEVEGTEQFGNRLEGVMVGEVLDVKPHPDADRLQLCKVELGKEQVQIVCGAPNVAQGQKVPVATVGTTLPLKLDNGDFLTIKKAKLRGEESQGMICAEDELGLGTEHDGIMVLNDSFKAGTPLHEVMELYQDTAIDIAITPNRPDATCHLGVARDLSAALNIPLHKPFKTDFGDAESLEGIDIEIKNAEKCHRYTAKLIKGVTIAESPAWLQNKLKAIGVRPVNNVVDATSYVMYELGQPLHAFDLATIRGNKIVVTDFDKEITFETLDHIKRKCPAGTLFICDDEGPVAIAGVMGGVDSEVSENTRDILLESAYFDPGSIRRTAKEQALQTDASYRFERGIDPNLQRIAAERAASLIAELGNGQAAKGCTDVHPTVTNAHTLTLRASYTNRLLGTAFSTDEISSLLDGLGLTELKKDAHSISYSIPTYRPDLEREVDLIEEVGRLYDYNKIPSPKHGHTPSTEPINNWERLKTKIRETAKGMRFREMYSNSLIPEKDALRFADKEAIVYTLNPISADMTSLRPTLAHGFLKSAAYNFNRNIKGVRFFETGNIFRRSDKGTYHSNIQEETCLLLGVSGYRTTEHWKTEAELYDIFDLKAALESMLGQFVEEASVRTIANAKHRLEYEINGLAIGSLYRIDDSLLEAYELETPAFAAELSIDKLQTAIQRKGRSEYTPVPKFPAFEFDFAVVVDTSVPAGDLLTEIRKTAGASLQNLQVFDVFEGESLGEQKKSLAFRLSFIDKNKTLTINDIEPIINKVTETLEHRFSAKLRS